MSTTDAFVDYNISAEEREKLDEMGLECPADCAFAFTCFAEASAHGVGGAWLATRRSARAMTSVASASWRSIGGSPIVRGGAAASQGFHMQAKHGVHNAASANEGGLVRGKVSLSEAGLRGRSRSSALPSVGV